MYEDLKLNKLRNVVDSPRLAQLLLTLAVTMDSHRKAAHIEYYAKKNREAFAKDEYEQDIKRAFKDGHAIREGIDIEPVPRILKCLEECLT